MLFFDLAVVVVVLDEVGVVEEVVEPAGWELVGTELVGTELVGVLRVPSGFDARNWATLFATGGLGRLVVELGTNAMVMSSPLCHFDAVTLSGETNTPWAALGELHVSTFTTPGVPEHRVTPAV